MMHAAVLLPQSCPCLHAKDPRGCNVPAPRHRRGTENSAIALCRPTQVRRHFLPKCSTNRAVRGKTLGRRTGPVTAGCQGLPHPSTTIHQRCCVRPSLHLSCLEPYHLDAGACILSGPPLTEQVKGEAITTGTTKTLSVPEEGQSHLRLAFGGRDGNNNPMNNPFRADEINKRNVKALSSRVREYVVDHFCLRRGLVDLHSPVPPPPPPPPTHEPPPPQELRRHKLPTL